MALQTLEGDLIPMRPAKEPLTRYAVLLLGAAILSFGLFNVHSQSGVTEGGVLGTTLLLNKFTKLTLSKSYFMTDAIVLALSLTYIPAGRIVFSFITVTLSSFLIERIQRIGAPCAAAEQGA